MISNKNILYTIHTSIFAFLLLTTIPFLELIHPIIYIVFCSLFFSCQIYSLYSIYNYKNGYFTYIFSNLLFLGFPVKFSLHAIRKHPYIEPTGRFQFTPESMKEVILVSSIGVLGLLLSQIVCNKFKIRKLSFNYKIFSLPKLRRKTWILILFALSSIFFLINQKYNILLYGFKPYIILPLKGNGIFFNLFTRAFIFLFLLKAFNRDRFILNLILGTLLAMIASIGVYSRMITVIYLLTIIIYMIFHFEIIEKPKVYISFILAFLISSLLTVHFSTKLREYKSSQVTEYSLTSKILRYSLSHLISIAKADESHEQKLGNQNSWRIIANKVSPLISTYSGLFFERWIGMEGVMAVQSFPEKSISFFNNALIEKKYQGHSLYTKVSEPERYKAYSQESQVVTTSVPGPIAFFYYTNSYFLVFLLMFISSTTCNLIAQTMAAISNNQLVIIFTAVFITFDFFQLGISPRTLLYNWLFTFTYIYLFTFSEQNKIDSNP